MGILKSVLGSAASAKITTSIEGDYTITFNDTRIEVDATSGNIVLTLPTITDAYKQRQAIEIKRIDDFSNTVTINGTSSNLQDGTITLLGLEGVSIYASNTNIWRTLT